MCPQSNPETITGSSGRIGIQDLKVFLNPVPNNDAEKRIAEHEELQHRHTECEFWRQSGVRLRHRDRPARRSPGPWEDYLHVLEKQLGHGMLVAIIGVRGCGKTQMAVELIRQTCAREKPAIYTTAMEIFVALRDSYKLQESEQQVLRRYQNPTLLVIDEIQERGESPWEDRLLTAIIDYRYSMMRDTALISNQTEPEFKKSMGTSVISRMIETGGIMECNWPSFRERRKISHSP